MHELVEAPGAEPSPPAAEHLRSCELCRRNLDAFREAEGALAGLREPPLARTPFCPADEDLASYAAGTLDEKRGRGIREHSEGCAYCAAELNFHRLMMEGESGVSGIEFAVAATPSPAALNRMASGTPGRAAGWVAVAAGIILAGGLGLWWSRPAQPPNDLLARAFTERRNMELRFPDAAHTPVRVTQGPSPDAPAALLEARAVLAREKAKHPDDPAWLQAEGRAALLEWDTEAAMRAFRRALDLRPEDPDLWTGLASAHFQRGEAASYAEMSTALLRALELRPADPVAQFNLAIAYEKLFLYGQAVAAWEKFLAGSPGPGWEQEARERLEAVKKKPATSPAP